MDMGGDGSQRSGNGSGRFLQSMEDMSSSCADLKTEISSLDSDSPDCAMSSTFAYGSCGCTDDPPAGSCYSCPFGGTFNKDTVPDLPEMGEIGQSMPSDATCGELARSFGITQAIFGALAGAFDENGGSQTIEDIDFCGMIRSPCGCKPDPDACTICEFGLKNPDFKPDIEGNKDDQFTCAQAVQMTEQFIIGNEGPCDEAKEGAVKGGCVCKTSAAVNKNIVTLLVISAATTMLAFLG
eukprot:CAMPEP_0198262260 /NCGR_PEP_ID=MMETSP1447-20131203/10798_1 /TAXON_ID=420782 /ORGANISM="Chaetoceros dichaeta, Strain CCMP1751" /LENGTH=238 /DNA_ID=CAMNT_0043950441 /DNA_START=234 /DNA_END=950 /DNA_ORIENTATION=-